MATRDDIIARHERDAFRLIAMAVALPNPREMRDLRFQPALDIDGRRRKPIPFGIAALLFHIERRVWTEFTR